MKIRQLRPMKLKPLLAGAVLGLVATASIQDSFAQRRNPNRPNQGPRHQSPNHYGQNVLNVQRTMYDREKLFLSQTMNLQGTQSLIVNARSQSFDSKIVIRLNGERIHAYNLFNSWGETKIQLPYTLNSQDKLVMVVRGSAYVQSVQAIKRFNQGPQTVQKFPVALGQRITASTTLKVRQLVARQHGQGVLQGLELKKVILVASSARGRAQAQLIINGQPTGFTQTIPMGRTRLVFDLPQYAQNIVGQDIRTVQLDLRGRRITLHRLVVRAKDAFGYNDGPTLGNSQQFFVNTQITPRQRVRLANILQGQYVDSFTPIQSIILDVKGQGTIRVLAQGQMLGSATATGATTSKMIRVAGQASIQDIILRGSGRVVIKSVTIKYGY